MSDGFPDEVRQFIFESVDSIEQLEIMLLLRSTGERMWTAQEIASKLRTNSASVVKRLAGLKRTGVVSDDCATHPSYRYRPVTPEIAAIVDGLADTCKIRPHRVYELIFSSLKGARKFLDAFTLPGKKGGGDV